MYDRCFRCSQQIQHVSSINRSSQTLCKEIQHIPVQLEIYISVALYTIGQWSKVAAPGHISAIMMIYQKRARAEIILQVDLLH